MLKKGTAGRMSTPSCCPVAAKAVAPLGEGGGDWRQALLAAPYSAGTLEARSVVKHRCSLNAHYELSLKRKGNELWI